MRACSFTLNSHLRFQISSGPLRRRGWKKADGKGADSFGVPCTISPAASVWWGNSCAGAAWCFSVESMKHLSQDALAVLGTIGGEICPGIIN